MKKTPDYVQGKTRDPRDAETDPTRVDPKGKLSGEEKARRAR